MTPTPVGPREDAEVDAQRIDRKAAKVTALVIRLSAYRRAMQKRPDWSRRLPRPLVIPKVMTLTTLADVRELMRHWPRGFCPASPSAISHDASGAAMPARLSVACPARTVLHTAASPTAATKAVA